METNPHELVTAVLFDLLLISGNWQHVTHATQRHSTGNNPELSFEEHSVFSSPPSGPWTTSSASTYFPKRSKIMKYSWTWNGRWKMHRKLHTVEIRNRLLILPSYLSFCLYFLLLYHFFHHTLSQRQEHGLRELLVLCWDGLKHKLHWWCCFILFCMGSSLLYIVNVSEKTSPYLHHQAHHWPEVIWVFGDNFIQRHSSLSELWKNKSQSFNINIYFRDSWLTMQPY